MGQIRVRRALISVYDKTGIVEFAQSLHADFGIEIISTGGTAKTLRDAGIPVTLIEDITGFPEMLDGRVKTLHPNIHAAILADRDNPEHMRQLEAAGIKPIDMVVVNLYPFEKTVADPDCTLDQAIEMIDIGGVALLRAAAKNARHVWVVTDASDYKWVLSVLRKEYAGQEFARIAEEHAHDTFVATARYDDRISTWMGRIWEAKGLNTTRSIRVWDQGSLRYGENPSQFAEAFAIDEFAKTWPFVSSATGGGFSAEMSYNNYLDADAALGLCAELARAVEELGDQDTAMRDRSKTSPTTSAGPASSRLCCCVFIKHSNACGVGIHPDPLEAYRRAYLGDPNAAMGGVLACNFRVDAEFAAGVMSTFDRLGKPLRDAGAAHAPGGFFVEVWLAPEISDAAAAIIRGRAELLDKAFDQMGEQLSPTRLAEVRAILDRQPPKKWGESVRLLCVGDMKEPPNPTAMQYRSIAGGLLAQTPDTLALNESDWKVATNRAPTDAELRDLRLAWLICKHTKSNAISICKDGRLIGNGAGQMSRVMSCRIATWLAKENGHADALTGSVAASDAFFPFKDGPQILIDAGVTALIQPGGSKRDDETIALCNERGIAMILTGARHFRH